MMANIRKGSIAAIAAGALLAGIVGWRLYEKEDKPSVAQADALPGMSTAPTLEDLAARAAAEPDNPVLWQELGLARFSANRFAEAADAYERAVEADPDSAVLWSSLGEARVMASAGEPLPLPALEAFRRAIALDPQDPRARYFLAVEKDLAGDHEGAIAAWLALLADTPPGSPWENDLVRTIEQVGAINEVEVDARIAQASATRDILPPDAASPALSSTRGPTQEQMAAAASLSPDRQQAMAEGMVRQLADRLESRGGSVDDWIMLMRSYQQLGRPGEARRTLDRAREAHPSSTARIDQIASQLRID